MLLYKMSDLLWVAPEYLRTPTLKMSKEGDVYSSGIIVLEITTRSLPFESERLKMDVESKNSFLRAWSLNYCYDFFDPDQVM